jgi:hypothetical protein
MLIHRPQTLSTYTQNRITHLLLVMSTEELFRRLGDLTIMDAARSRRGRSRWLQMIRTDLYLALQHRLVGAVAGQARGACPMRRTRHHARARPGSRTNCRLSLDTLRVALIMQAATSTRRPSGLGRAGRHATPATRRGGPVVADPTRYSNSDRFALPPGARAARWRRCTPR